VRPGAGGSQANTVLGKIAPEDILARIQKGIHP
jgi:hypothetical protein